MCDRAADRPGSGRSTASRASKRQATEIPYPPNRQAACRGPPPSTIVKNHPPNNRCDDCGRTRTAPVFPPLNTALKIPLTRGSAPTRREVANKKSPEPGSVGSGEERGNANQGRNNISAGAVPFAGGLFSSSPDLQKKSRRECTR